MTVSKLPASQRQKKILNSINESGFVSVPDMAADCGVSEMTLRRDLDQLADQKLITRTHGGATASDGLNSFNLDLLEPSLDKRTTQNHEAKQAIAVMAKEMIAPGSTVALDIGTTIFELAELLQDERVSIFTNSLKIAVAFCQSTPKVYVPAGQVSGAEPSIIGAGAIERINEFYFDISFIGVSGLSTQGYYDYSMEDTEIKKALLKRAQKNVVLLDSSKFDRMSVALVATLNEIDVLVTNQEPPQPLKDAIDAAGTQIKIAQ